MLVPAPPEAVLAVLLDVERWPAWRPGLAAVASLTDRPVVAGAAWAEARRLAGRDLRLGGRAVQVEPHAFGHALSGDGLEATVRWELRPEGDGTLVTQACAARGRGLAARLAGLAPRFLEEQAAALPALAAAVAAAEAAPEPAAAARDGPGAGAAAPRPGRVLLAAR